MRTVRCLSVFIIVLFLIASCSDKTTAPKQTIAPLEFSVVSGTYYYPVEVAIASATEGVEIRFTTDGSPPSITSQLYLEPILFSESLVLSAKGYKDGWRESDTAILELEIVEYDDSDFIVTFHNAPDTHPLNEELNLTVQVFNSEGDPVLDGYLVVFHPNELGGYVGQDENGYFFASAVDGVASAIWKSGIVSGLAVIGVSKSGTVPGDRSQTEIVETEIFLPPDPPHLIELTQVESYLIRAAVADQYQNRVEEGIELFATISKGVIDETGLTDESGNAFFAIDPQGYAGEAVVAVSTAEGVVTTEMTIVLPSNEPAEVVFTSDQQIFLDVIGIGGDDSIEISVNLLNNIGDMVLGEHYLLYEIVDGTLGGANINGTGYSAEVVAIDGAASATLNTGTQSGSLSVRVSVIADFDVYAIKDGIIIRPGPPSLIESTVGGYNSGIDVGGGFWEVQVSTTIADVYGNPVSDGTEVQYHLASDPSPPEGVLIQETGLTINGFSAVGLSYNGIYTNREVAVISSTGELSHTIPVILPLNSPYAALSVYSEFVAVFPDTNLDSLFVHCTFILKDGQNNSITDSNILLSSSHGHFVYNDWVNDEGFPINDESTPQLIVTYQGAARGILKLRPWELPIPVEEYVTFIDVQIFAFIQGTTELFQTHITIRIYREIPNR